ncbi:hypothetical protein AHAS_Ahas05G0262300 [Arachis hypogaea]
MKTTNNFYLSCGMLRATLFDIAVITGLSSIGPVIIFGMKPEHKYNIVEKNSSGEFIRQNMGEKGTPVTDVEHVAFLYYWLNAIVFVREAF